jgi:NAD(P)-dependent dehydrogenase (short-subunit alcohol dehydrogenase family)
MSEDAMSRRCSEMTGLVSFKRTGEPEKIAEIVVSHCLDCASNVSGVCYNVDGGDTAL